MVTQFLTLDPTGTIPNVGLRDFLTTGTIYYVDSNVASAGDGLTPTDAVTTLAAAVALTTANKGDIIICMPNHAETITGNTEISTQGISVIGIGVGDNRPQFTFGTNTSADIELKADNIRLSNLIFKNDIDSQVAVVVIGAAAYCMVDNCEFIEGSSKQSLIGINLSNAGSDNATITHCKFVSVATGAASAIEIGAALSNLTISYCHMYGGYSDACIHNPTVTVALNLNIHHNLMTNLDSGDHAIELVSACTGMISHNVANSTLAAAGGLTAIDQGSCFCCENYGVDATADKSGLLQPVADS